MGTDGNGKSGAENGEGVSHGDFAGDAGFHLVDDFLVRVAVAQQEHEFRDHGLHRSVVAVDDASLQQLQSGFIPVHLYAAFVALGDVDDDDPFGHELAYAFHEPGLLGRIARAVGFEDDGFDAFHGETGVDHLLSDAGKEGEDHHIVVEQEMWFEAFVGFGTMYQMKLRKLLNVWVFLKPKENIWLDLVHSMNQKWFITI